MLGRYDPLSRSSFKGFNRGALFNLGYLVGSSEKKDDYVEALRLLTKAKTEAEEAGSWKVEPVWHLTSYWIVATHHYRNDTEQARKVAHEVHDQAEEVLCAEETSFMVAFGRHSQ
jgi:hypothetical protein